MILKEFINNLNEFILEHPEALDMQVITSIDDEGNGYNYVNYTPTIGFFEDDEFITESDENMNNAVCIN
jgi:hypothetical protein